MVESKIAENRLAYKGVGAEKPGDEYRLNVARARRACVDLRQLGFGKWAREFGELFDTRDSKMLTVKTNKNPIQT
jgi:hypothetical protein